MADAPLIPAPPPSWKLCDIDAMLRAGDHAALDELLDAALAASLVDRVGEGAYDDAWPGDLHGCTDAGPEGLARLRAWQVACPGSAHAHLAEAHYWFHWAYVYRGGGWAGSVSAAGWACAAACGTRVALSVLRALDRAPSMWAAPALLMQSVAAFGEPPWLGELMQQGKRRPEVLRDQVQADEAGADVDTMLAQSGLPAHELLDLPTVRPLSLPPAVQGKRVLRGATYWTHATLHVHPTLFFALRPCIWFMQPRWGGSHEKVRAFVASPACAHLGDVERSRLLHELWRDEYQGNTLDGEDEAAHVEKAMAHTRRVAAEARWPYHRWETLRWLAVSHYMLDQHPEALACLREAESHHPIDDDYALNTAIHVALDVDPQGHWLGEAALRSAQTYQSVAALVLRGYCELHGKLGVPRHEAAGRAWLQAVHEREPGSPAWDKVARAFWRAEHMAEAFDVLVLGRDAGGERCAYTLGLFHEDGLHGHTDAAEAMRCYTEAAQAGSAEAAHRLAGLLHAQGGGAAGQAVHWMQRAHDLGHDEALPRLLMFLGDLDDRQLRPEQVSLVRDHAEAGHATAMAAWSRWLSDSTNKTLYDYGESVRWMLGALAMAPDDTYVRNVFEQCHQDGFLSRLLYRLHRRQVKPHQIPGADNLMV
jgi:TPR repeat protein